MRHCCIRALGPTSDWLEFPMPASPGDIDRLKLVQEAPEFIGMLGEAEVIPKAAAVLTNSVSGRVLVAVDEKGKVVLVGCPDQHSDAGISTMVGDLLAASGRLWHQPVAVLAEMFGGEAVLVEQVRSRSPAGFSSENFKADLEKTLEAGKFGVVIVVDRVDKAVEEMMGYLKGMNLAVRLLTYERFYQSGIEVIIPKLVGEEAKVEQLKEPVIKSPATSFREWTPTVSTFSKDEQPEKSYEPFPVEGVTPKQQAILERLVFIDDIGLIRRGFEFFTPRALERPQAEGTIVVAVDTSRWPFPKDNEVVVVVRTTREHLAGFLKMKQQEVEDFLRSLPRDEKKEHKGVLLLWARNVYEANQLVNELKALKEVSQTGVR